LQELNDYSVIVVPDFTKHGTAPGNSHPWLHEILRPQQAQAQIIRFSYQITMKGPSVWHQLRQRAQDLVDVFRHKTELHKVGQWSMYQSSTMLI
jgi:hypothetical protein